MNEQMNGRGIARLRPLVFLLPAVASAALIFATLPLTRPVLAELPERLERAATAVTEAVTPTESIEEILPEEIEPEETESLAPGDYEDGVYTGSAQGYGGTVTVQVTVENGRIADIVILSAPGETEPYITLAETVLGMVVQAQTWEVDAVSGATYSSRGLLGAIQNALTGETVVNEAPTQTTPAGTTTQDSFTEPAAYKDGTYYGTAEGFGGTIQVEVVIADGALQSIRVVSAPYETAEYLSRAKNVISTILSAGSPNVDAVSGATYSSTGIINAVKRALNQAATDGTDAQDDPTGEEGPGQDDPADDEPEPDETAYRDGEYTTVGWCEDEDGTFRYELAVTVTVAEGRIASVNVEKGADESEYPEDNEPFLNRALNGRGQTAGIPEQITEAQGLDGVDAVSGATYSSETIRALAARAIAEASVSEEEPSEEPSEEPEEDPSEEPGEEPTEENGEITGEPSAEPETEVGTRDDVGEEPSGKPTPAADDSDPEPLTVSDEPPEDEGKNE